MIWLNKCYGEDAVEPITDNTVVCSGTVGGAVSEFRKYLDIMLYGECDLLKCNEDQPQLNYMLYSGVFSAMKLQYTFRTCDNVITMSTCPFKKHYSKVGILPRTKKGCVPVMVHQFTHHGDTWNMSQVLCSVSELKCRLV